MKKKLKNTSLLRVATIKKPVVSQITIRGLVVTEKRFESTKQARRYKYAGTA